MANTYKDSKSKKTDYEQAIDDVKNDNITEWSSVQEFFDKMGI